MKILKLKHLFLGSTFLFFIGCLEIAQANPTEPKSRPLPNIPTGCPGVLTSQAIEEIIKAKYDSLKGTVLTVRYSGYALTLRAPPVTYEALKKAVTDPLTKTIKKSLVAKLIGQEKSSSGTGRYICRYDFYQDNNPTPLKKGIIILVTSLSEGPSSAESEEKKKQG